jgi:hypothetical protein
MTVPEHFIHHPYNPTADKLSEAVYGAIWTGMAHDDPTPAEAKQTARNVLEQLARPANRPALVAWLVDLGVDLIDPVPSVD